MSCARKRRPSLTVLDGLLCPMSTPVPRATLTILLSLLTKLCDGRRSELAPADTFLPFRFPSYRISRPDARKRTSHTSHRVVPTEETLDGIDFRRWWRVVHAFSTVLDLLGTVLCCSVWKTYGCWIRT